jgi:signal-transduction protein with cAMP-binding, CBS, and nucleotidyltransferase domain
MGASEFEEAYEDDERRIRGAIFQEAIAALEPHAPSQLSPEASVSDAVRAMNESGTGCVCVVEAGSLIGIFTERDLLRLTQKERSPAGLPLSKVMTPEPERLRPEDGIALALNVMVSRGFRHIPLVDADGRPTGIVSMRDIVRFIVSMFPDRVWTAPPDPSAIPGRYGG